MPRMDRTFRIGSGRHYGFTLTELLVVIAIIGIVGTLTVVAYRGIATDARLASAENAIVAGLDRARGLAMKNSDYVMLVFRSVIDENRQQRTEMVTTRWTGQSFGPLVDFCSPGASLVRPVDRFRPVPGAPVRLLPRGIGVGAPTYGYAPDCASFDPGGENRWFTLANLRNVSEAPGNMIGVLYSPEGTVISRNATTDSYRQYVDFNNDLLQNFEDGNIDYNNVGTLSGAEFDEEFFEHEPDTTNDPPIEEEPYLRIAPFLAVYDDDAARAQFITTTWSDPVTRLDDQSQFVNSVGRRVHFNRYSGVVMR